MADIDITVDNSDLKAALDLLRGFETDFIRTLNKVQTETNKWARANKASTSQIAAAFDLLENSFSKASNTLLADMLRAENIAANKIAADAKKAKAYWDDFNKTIGITGDRATALGATFSKLGDILQRESQQTKAYWDSFNDSLGINRAFSSAEASAESFGNAIDRLTTKYNPAIAAAQRFDKIQKEIKLARTLDIISLEEQREALARLKVEYDAFNSRVMLAGSRFNDLTQTGLAAGRSVNRFGMYAQQAGYQIGDFAVQVQMGTNVGVAFAQQAAQLAGLMPGLVGAITAFAAIGLGIFIQQMTRANREAKELNLTVSEIKDFSTIFRSAGAALETSLVRSIQRVREHFGDFVADVMDFDMRQLRRNLTANLQDVIPQATYLDPEANRSWFERAFIGIGVSQSPGLAMSIADQADQFNAVMDRVEGIMNDAINSDMVRTTQDMAEAWVGAHDQIREYVSTQNIAEDQQQSIIDNLVRIAKESGIWAEIQGVIQERERGTLDLIRQGADARVAYNEKLREAAQFRIDESLALVDQLLLQQRINRYGEQSTQVLDEIRRQELARYETELRRQDLNQDQIDSLMSIKAAVIDAEQASQRWENTQQAIYTIAQRISGIDLSGGIRSASSAAEGLLGRLQSVLGVLGQIGRIGLSNAALAAENAALASGASPAMARVEGQMVEFNQSLPAGTPQFLRTMLNMGQRAALTEGVRLNEENSSLIDAWNDANDSGGGGGSSSNTSVWRNLERELEQRRRLIGLSEEEYKITERIIQIEQQLGDERKNITESQIRQMALAQQSVEDVLEREEEARQRQEQMVATFSNNIENAFMSIVTGSENVLDAAKSMIRGILLEFYQQQVAKPAAEFLGNLLGNMFMANGGAFVGGRLQAYASGGVVDSPTFFNHSGGRGLMGEAGPEAILPLRRASNGKLGVQVSGGASESIVINQSFNFSANGDESVKAIIRQESRSIVEQTKRAVVDAKNRGKRGY